MNKKVSPNVKLARANVDVAKAEASMVEAQEKRSEALSEAGITGDALVEIGEVKSKKKKIKLDFKNIPKKYQLLIVLGIIGVLVYFALTNWQVLIAIVIIGGWGIWEYGKWKKRKEKKG